MAGWSELDRRRGEGQGRSLWGDAVVSGGPFTNHGAVTMMVQDANNKAADYTQFLQRLDQ